MLVILALIVVVLGVVGKRALERATDPNRPETWLLLLRESEDRAANGMAFNALGLMGPQALPAMRDAARDPNPKVRAKLAKAFGYFPHVEAVPELQVLLNDSDLEVCYQAMWALGNLLIEYDASPATREAACGTAAEVLEIVRRRAPVRDRRAKRDLHGVAAVVLGRFGEPAVPALVEALGDPKLRRVAAYALTRMDQGETKAAVAALTPLLSDEDSMLRKHALNALGHAGPAGVSAHPALLQILETGSDSDRQRAIGTLGKIGRSSPKLTDTLLRTLAAPDAKFRAEAAQALGRLRPSNAQLASALFERVADPDETLPVRRCAAWSLAELAPTQVDADVLQWLEEHPAEDERVAKLLKKVSEQR